MRAIDADALKETFEIAYKEARHDREYANAFFSDAGAVSTEWWCVEDMVDNAPTIEPQSKKGVWIVGKDGCYCSECGSEFPSADYNFCPECGTDMRMRGDVNDM